MKNLAKFTAGLMLSASLFTTAWADTITMWTMEEQPDRMAAQEKIAAAFTHKLGIRTEKHVFRHRYRIAADVEAEVPPPPQAYTSLGLTAGGLLVAAFLRNIANSTLGTSGGTSLGWRSSG